MSAPQASAPPDPEPGSPRYFVLLYTPPARRAALAALLAVSDEISAGLTASLDHSIAHVRLQFWQRECELWQQARAQHPFLRVLQTLPGARRIELTPLITAAANDLASQTLAQRPGTQLQAALFVACAQLLTDTPLSSAQQTQLSALGLAAAADSQTAPADAHRALDLALQGLDPALQPPLAPLLVWCSLRRRQLSRSAAKRAPGRLALLADNWIAWRAARGAQSSRSAHDESH